MTPEQEQILLQRVADLERKLGYPMSNDLKKIIEITNFDILHFLRFKLGAITPIADGTYVVGAKLSQFGSAGTITVKSGIITSITQAS